MMLANIVSTNKVEAPKEFNIVKTMGEIILGLPTLIIGYDYVNKHYPDFDITDISLAPDLYWTFKRTEKRDKYEEDLRFFIRKVYHDKTSKTMYIFVDPIQYRSKTLIKCIRKIYALKSPIGFIDGEMVYIYAENLIFGVDLKLLRYVGIDSDKVKEKIKRICSVFLEESQIIIEYKKDIVYLEDKTQFIPYLYSLRNGQNNDTGNLHIPKQS